MDLNAATTPPSATRTDELLQELATASAAELRASSASWSAEEVEAVLRALTPEVHCPTLRKNALTRAKRR